MRRTRPATPRLDPDLKRSFLPVVDGRTRLLVLGSLPGEESLRQAHYYAHPRNQFWALIGAVIGADLVGMTYQARLERLLAAGMGLWDVVGSARRRGSLDAAIRDQTPNPLPDLVATLPELRAVAFNGATSARIGSAALAQMPIERIALPSSSPALTTPFDAKLAQWLELRRFLST